MKTIVAVLLSVVVALWLTPGTTFVLADGEEHEHEAGEFEVTFSSSPRFPVVGEEAELTFRVSHDENHAEGMTVMVTVAKAEEVNHHHAGEEEANHHHDEDAAVEPVEITASETAPGVYVAKYTFEEGGKYRVTPYLGDEHTEFVVAVRSSPVAWPFVIGLGVVSVLLAGVVAVIKTVRKEW